MTHRYLFRAAVVTAVALTVACGGKKSAVPANNPQPDRFLMERADEALKKRRWADAREYYRQVVDKYPTSPRAAAALYNLGLLAERRKDMAGARDAYQRVTQKYPQSDEAALARDRLKALGR